MGIDEIEEAHHAASEADPNVEVFCLYSQLDPSALFVEPRSFSTTRSSEFIRQNERFVVDQPCAIKDNEEIDCTSLVAVFIIAIRWYIFGINFDCPKKIL